MQTGSALRDLFVVPPRECRRREFYWLLLTAAYGLVNANAKWQQHSDEFLHTLGFAQVSFVPQLFYMMRDGFLCLLAVKFVDDIIICGDKTSRTKFIDSISRKDKVGTIVDSPGTFLFFGLTISQDEDGTVSVSDD